MACRGLRSIPARPPASAQLHQRAHPGSTLCRCCWPQPVSLPSGPTDLGKSNRTDRTNHTGIGSKELFLYLCVCLFWLFWFLGGRVPCSSEPPPPAACFAFGSV